MTFSNDKAPPPPYLLNPYTTVKAGQVPFLTQEGLAVLPISSIAYYKAPQNLDAATQQQYQLLYQTFINSPTDTLTFYQPTVLGLPATGKPGPVVDLGDPVAGAIDRSLWLAIVAQPGTSPDVVRAAIAGQTLSIGVYPATQSSGQVLQPMTTGGPTVDPGLIFEIAAPAPDPTGLSGPGYGIGPPNYTRLPITYADPVLQAPGIVQVTLPAYEQILLWNFDPDEEGTLDYPPRLDDATVSNSLVTWVRLRLPPDPTSSTDGTATSTTPSAIASTTATVTGANGTTSAANGTDGSSPCNCGCDCLGGMNAISTTAVLASDAAAAASNQLTGALTWVGVNATSVSQVVPVAQEPLGTGTGTPFQTFSVANTPVVMDATGFLLEVQGTDGAWQAWQQIDDIYAASATATAYTLDPASGTVTGGSGLFGARFPLGAAVRATYRYGGGLQGQVGIGAISKSTLPGGFSLTNPVATWGASNAESVSDGEANITRWLRHRDRLVTAQDFSDITRRTPGIDLGRVEVLPLFNPDAPDPTSKWPGTVTVMVIPSSDPVHPNAPVPDMTFLNAVCSWLDPRRLVTTEVYVRGPVYQQIWVSVGIEILPGQVASLVQAAVTAAVQAFLSPLTGGLPNTANTGLVGPSPSSVGTGWPLNTNVRSQDIEAVATRVPGVRYVDGVLIAGTTADGSIVASMDPVMITGLQLPAVALVSVNTGAPEAPTSLMGGSQAVPQNVVAVPVVPPTC